jgi:ABC-2 type transport system ATP-binding protein
MTKALSEVTYTGSPVQTVSAPPIISVRDVTMRFPIAKRYREIAFHPFRPRRVHTALTDASVEVATGDRIAVMGPNGAGKTTFLKLIGGLLVPTQGQVIVDGRDTVHHNTSARRSVGFMFNEERSFFWRLSAIQNLEFFGALDNLRGKVLQDRIQELIHLVGLEKAANRLVGEYSSGMKQRLALARGLISDPRVLILDEPTRALDPVACEELVELIMSRVYAGSGKTLLIATHKMEEAMELCNKVLVINSGRIKSFESIADLTAEGISLSEHYRSNVQEAKS